MKKAIRIFNWAVMIPGFALVFASCVKKDPFYKKDTTESSRKQLVEIVGGGGLTSYARDAKTTNDTFSVVQLVRYPNNEADLNQPLTVTLQQDSAMIDAYNTANGTSYIQLPADAYTLSPGTGSVTFPAGVSNLPIVIVVDQTKLDLSQQYALGFDLSSTDANSVVDPDLNNALYSIGVKNKYDGTYEFVLNTVGWGAYGISDGVSLDWSAAAGGTVGLVTAGASEVVLDIGYQPAMLSDGITPTGFGATDPEFTFDPNTNLLTSVVNLSPPDSRNRAFAINPAVTDSRWDPATKNVYMAYLMFQTGRPTQYIYDTLYYKGAR